MSEISGDEYRPAARVWERSSTCESSGCVEVMRHVNVVCIRPSTAPDKVISFTAAEWRAFLQGVERGEFRV
jgi:hypothetical protein